MRAPRRTSSTDITAGGAIPPLPAAPASPDISTSQIVPAIDRQTLIIAPFRLLRGRQAYLLRREVRIDLREIVPDHYRILAVQDFWSDDDNPNLSESLAGIFLARRRTSGTWEEPESWPAECRALAILGAVDTRLDPYVLGPAHGG